jgi:hypothetical protein
LKINLRQKILEVTNEKHATLPKGVQILEFIHGAENIDLPLEVSVPLYVAVSGGVKKVS